MSTHDHSFMPPDEPTAVYPIGAITDETKAHTPVQAEPPEPPQLSADVLEEASGSTNGFNPMVAVGLLVIPLVMGVGAVVLAGILLSLK